MMILRFSALAIAAMLASACSINPPAADPRHDAFIPFPQTVTRVTAGEFVLGPETVIYVPPGDAEAQRIGSYLSDIIGIAAGPEAPRVEPDRSGTAPGGIHLRLTGAASGRKEAEGYELTVDSTSVTLSAP